MAQTYVTELTPKSADLPRWYTEVIQKAELADYWLIHGFQVLRPYGYALWEIMQALLDARFKATGHRNVYFPLLLPESLLKKEAEHVAGFAPQVAWVTAAGTEELPERLAIRPTSEAIFGTMYAKWVQSWRDLPLLLNQWCSVVRWEKATRFFLRTTEFLWQEGHTAHRTAEEAQAETMQMLEIYRDFVERDLAVPVIPGQKSESEKFAGAEATYTIEALMPDGQALQSATSHFLGQNFARAFDITFQDLDGQRKHVWTTSWGLSTRIVGAVIMTHGDDSGLIFPPRVAPIQAIIIPIPGKGADEQGVDEAVEAARRQLAARFRVEVDRSEKTPGWKFNEWELRGVPVRVEIGPRDVRSRQAVVVRRDTREKRAVPLEGLADAVGETLEALGRDLFERARSFRDSRISRVATLAELQQALRERPGFVLAHWCGSPACEAAVKEQTGATIRCIPFGEPEEEGRCLVDGQPSRRRALFARAY
ncbi:MAG TPA: proline--tRNA ligase [Isosphaeraceae bacterium]|nr:proline--tRNA ligase [Isosphaeraceae bacterium]